MRLAFPLTFCFLFFSPLRYRNGHWQFLHLETKEAKEKFNDASSSGARREELDEAILKKAKKQLRSAKVVKLALLAKFISNYLYHPNHETQTSKRFYAQTVTPF